MLLLEGLQQPGAAVPRSKIATLGLQATSHAALGLLECIWQPTAAILHSHSIAPSLTLSVPQLLQCV